MRPLKLVVAGFALMACRIDAPRFVSGDDGGPDAAGGYRVGGTVDGLWSPAGVSLRLQAGDVDETLSVDANGSFTFPSHVADGTSYVVQVAAQPDQHTCSVPDGTGVVSGADANVDVRCTGPISVEMTLDLPFDWSFDASLTGQVVSGSVLLQSTSFDVTAPEASTIMLDGVPLVSGVPSQPVHLNVGAAVHDIDLTVGSYHRTYRITTNRGVVDVQQPLYVKSSNSGPGHAFTMGLAADGNLVVVGSPGEGSAASGVDGDQSDTSKPGAGAAYVLTRNGAQWAQTAYLKASNPDAGDNFGKRIAVSNDTVVVGAPGESSSSAGVDGDQTLNDAQAAGAVYVFRLVNGTWTQEAYLKASNPDAGDEFGAAVAIWHDEIVIGAPFEASAATGINSTQADNTASQAGAVYVFTRNNGIWSQMTYLKASNTDAGDRFGYAVAIENDRLAVGAPQEAGDGEGPNAPNQTDNSLPGSGAVYVFRNGGAQWAQEMYLKATNHGGAFGWAVSMSGGNLAVSAQCDSSDAIGINGDPNNINRSCAGAVYTYASQGNIWTVDTYFKASNPDALDFFGWSVSLLGDALAVGALQESSAATGINGDQTDNSLANAGAVYLFTKHAGFWQQDAYIKASNTGREDAFGASVALTPSGLFGGADLEDSMAQGIGGDQSSNSAQDSGAAYGFQ